MPSQSGPSRQPPGTASPATHTYTPPHYKNRHPEVLIATAPATNADHPASLPGHPVREIRRIPDAPTPYTIHRRPILPQPSDIQSLSTYLPCSSLHLPCPHPTPSPAAPPSIPACHCVLHAP